MRIYITTKLDLEILQVMNTQDSLGRIPKRDQLTDGSWNPSKMAKMKIDAI